VQKRKTFFKSLDYIIYLELIREFAEKAGVTVWAYCLMPNHIHMIVVPSDEMSLAKCFGPAHSRYATKINAVHGWQGHLWQQRFYSVAMDEAHTLVAIRYVELNPVRAGMCKSAEDWRWSSARIHLSGKDDELVDTAATRGLIPDWSQYLRTGSLAEQQDALRTHTRTGRPIGNNEFIENLEARTGRTIRHRKSGPQPSSGD
jgi:putative transposase